MIEGFREAAKAKEDEGAAAEDARCSGEGRGQGQAQAQAKARRGSDRYSDRGSNAEGQGSASSARTESGSKTNAGFLSSVGVDLGHQEMQAILGEVEQIFESQPGEWLPVGSVAQLVAFNLGYEDIGELHSALNMTLPTFLSGFPHIRLRRRAKNVDEGVGPEGVKGRPGRIRPEAEGEDVVEAEEEADGLEFTVEPERSESEWKPLRMRYRVNSTKDLWVVFLKSKHCTVRIPELDGFEFVPDGVRRVDTIYNHIGTAIFNLGNHVRQGPGRLSNYTTREKIMETVYKMNLLLDVPFPFTWEVYDPSGISEFKPSTNVQVLPVEKEAP